MRTTPSQLPDAKYLAFIENLLKICRDNLLLYKIPEADYTKAENLEEKARTAFEINAMPATKNKITVLEKNEAFKELKTYMSWFNKSLEANLNIPNIALIEMGLPSREHTHHGDHPRPKRMPVVTLSKEGLETTLFFAQQEHNHPTESIVDEFVHGARIEFRFDNDTVWQSETVTKKRYTFIFTEEDAGKQVHVRVAWVNTKLEAGPYCREFTFIVG
jgi:hypothetical protein